MIDWTKPIQTRDGRKARVMCTDLNKEKPVIVAVASSATPNKESYEARYHDGRFYRTQIDALDIVNVLDEKVRYANVYPGFIGAMVDAPDLLEESSIKVGEIKLTFVDRQLKKVEIHDA